MAIFIDSNGQQMLFACGRRGSNYQNNSNISVTADGGAFAVRTPYNANFVAELKVQIPASDRKWDNARKIWLVAKDQKELLKQIIDQNYSCNVEMPEIIGGNSQDSFEIIFRAEYVANCKSDASSVYSSGGWNAKIPENVLRKFFKQTKENEGNLYGLLSVDQNATELEIKKAYKRAARQWHPDVCREQNAREMFEKIKGAYDVLVNTESRNKYNAGLFFEKMARFAGGNHRSSTYLKATFTPTLRCGDLKVIAKKQLGLLIVEEILEWNDITDEFGRTMVSFWDGDGHSVIWV